MTALLRDGARYCGTRCQGSQQPSERCKCLCSGRLHGTSTERRGGALDVLRGLISTDPSIRPLIEPAAVPGDLLDEPLPGL